MQIGPNQTEIPTDILLLFYRKFETLPDTKTAILLFNRNKDFSSVLKKVPDAVTSHQNFKRQLVYQHDTAFRFTFGHLDDRNRELLLTIIAFNMPI